MTANPQGAIVIITSDPQVSYLLERILSPGGYLVRIENDPAQAWSKIEIQPPDLIIISQALEQENGLKIAGQISARLPGLPVILFAHEVTVELLQSALRIGIADVLCPPLRAEQINASVKAVLERASGQRQWAMRESRRSTDYLQRQVDDLETLTLVGRTITASLDLDTVLTAIVDAAVGLTGAEEGSLLLLDDTTGELYMRAGRNFQEDFVRTFRLPVNDSLAGAVIRTGQPVSISEKTPTKIKTAYLVQNLLYVPLQLHGQVIGVLGVDNRHNSLPFTELHLKALTAMAEFAVIAIENARLYAHTLVERNKLETILTKIQDGVIFLDTTNRIQLINQTVRDAFFLGEAYLMGKPVTEVFEQEELCELIRLADKHIFSRGEITLDDGRVFGTQLTPIQDVGLVITMHDITYLKKLDRIKSDFVTTISQELRSPLTRIMGYVGLLDRAGSLSDQQRDYIRHVETGVLSITALVDDLLNLGRIEAGFDTFKENIDLNQFIQPAVDSFKNLIVEKRQQFIMEIPAGHPVLFGNPIQLRQIVDKLLDNATKYTLPGGIIKLRVAIEDRQALIQVIDNGLGIPASDLPYVFDKFYRASNVPIDAVGSGLGLSIVKSIVDNHQGRVWVDSTPNQGSTFTVVLPLADT